MLHRAVRPPSVRGHQWLISPCILGTDPTHLQLELFIIHTQTLVHPKLCLVRGKCPVLQDKQEGLLMCEVAVLAFPCLTALLYFSLIIHTFCCSFVLFSWLSGEMGCGNNHQCSWPADKKGAFSLLLLREGTSIQALHDSLCPLVIIYVSPELFRLLKSWYFFCIFGQFIHALFICSLGSSSYRFSCRIQRKVQFIRVLCIKAKNNNNK